MSVLPPPARATPTDTEPSPAPALIVAAGLVLALGRGAVELAGHDVHAPAWVREVDQLIPLDAMLPLFVGLFAAGAIAQGWRLAWLHGHQLASVSYRRSLDWALVILGVVALLPALDPDPSKWVDPWFYLFTVCGGLMVAVSVACLRRRA